MDDNKLRQYKSCHKGENVIITEDAQLPSIVRLGYWTGFLFQESFPLAIQYIKANNLSVL